jgi:hypothetical protein
LRSPTDALRRVVRVFVSEHTIPFGTCWIASQVRVASLAEGAILLDTRRSSFTMLTSAAADVCVALQAGASEEQVVEALSQRYEASTIQLASDVRALFGWLESAGLITTRGNARPPITQARRRSVVEQLAGRLVRVALLGPATSLLWARLLLRSGSLASGEAVLKAIRSRSGARSSNTAEVERLVHSVRGTWATYLVKTACLESALSAALLAARKGVRLDWVIGVRTPPFEAHSWVEIGGQAVDESRTRINSMTVLMRV